MTTKRVLFLCTHNSARSQMAEGYLRALGSGRFEAMSAGTRARGLHPLAVQAMAEEGIDISLQESKSLAQFVNDAFDVVVTVCDDANESCPYFANAKERRHWSFPDPSAALGDDETRFAAFREVRDAIRERIEQELL
ncbi:MAG TPA: arsenate reductase ArsC [Candidatus Limnocylindria bacterium]